MYIETIKTSILNIMKDVCKIEKKRNYFQNLG